MHAVLSCAHSVCSVTYVSTGIAKTQHGYLENDVLWDRLVRVFVFVFLVGGVFDMPRLACCAVVDPSLPHPLDGIPEWGGGVHERADTLGTDIINKRLEGDIQLQSWPVA